MGVLLEVKEFDQIVCNPDYENDERYKYLNEKDFNKLVTFIQSNEPSEDNADALSFMQISYKRFVGQVVTVKNYVGLIEFDDGSQLQILPKVSFGDGDDNDVKTKKVFIQMLRSMKDFPSKIFNSSSLKVDDMNLYEVFINMYLQEVRRLLKVGLKSSYVGQEDNLKFFKGKLLTNQHLISNLTHKERFYMGYDEFNLNRPENKLIKATLQRLNKITSSANNSKEIRQLLASFEMVNSSDNYSKDFSSVKIDRASKEYENLMQWSKVFLMNKSFSTFSGPTTARALLFPMESVFESYVAKQLKKVIDSDDWEVSVQDKGFYLFNRPREQFALRPDIVLKKNERIIIIDTKWKSLVNNERKNYGISQADMYQMYAYSKKYSTPEIWLLYPINDEMRGHEDIIFTSNDKTTVSVYFVEVDKIEDSLRALVSNKIQA